MDIGGKPLIQHVYEASVGSSAQQVIIATDDERISDFARTLGAECIMTSTDHTSGTDRITETIKKLNESDDTVIVNVQGDEFGLPPALIDQVATALHKNPEKSIATLCEKISNIDEYDNPNSVKVILAKDNTAIYFSRAPIPWSRAQKISCQAYRHIGLYAYRAEFLKIFSALAHCPLEISEELEQLRAIYYGYKIHVEKACVRAGIGIDTEADLELARKTVKTQ